MTSTPRNAGLLAVFANCVIYAATALLLYALLMFYSMVGVIAWTLYASHA